MSASSWNERFLASSPLIRFAMDLLVMFLVLP